MIVNDKIEKSIVTLDYPSISVVVRTRNRLELLKNCIRSLQDLDFPNYQIIIVNDASTDGTQEFLNNQFLGNPQFVIVNNKKHFSSAFLYNFGIEYSRNDIVAFTDDDCIVEKNWLKELAVVYLEDKDAMSVLGQPYFEMTTKKMHAPGCNMSFRREVFRQCIFDKWLTYSHLHDEQEMFERMEKQILKNEKAIVYHFTKTPTRIKAASMRLGWSLNVIYKHAKRVSSFAYYKDIFLYMFYRIQRKQGFHAVGQMAERLVALEADIPKFIEEERARENLSKIYLKCLWLYYVLLIEIPIKGVLMRLFRFSGRSMISGKPSL